MYEQQGVVLCADCHCVLWRKHGQLCAACKAKRERAEKQVVVIEPSPAKRDHDK